MASSTIAAHTLPSIAPCLSFTMSHKHLAINFGGLWTSRSFRARRGLCWVKRLPQLPLNSPACPEIWQPQENKQLLSDPGCASPLQRISRNEMHQSGRGCVNQLISFHSEFGDSPVVSSTRNGSVNASLSSISREVTNFQAGVSGLSAKTFGVTSTFQGQILFKVSRQAELNTKVARESSEPYVDWYGTSDSQNGELEDSESVGPERISLVTRVFLERKDDSGISKLDKEWKQVGGFQQGWFPYLDQFRLKDTTINSAEILGMLGPFLFEERKQRIGRVVANRTYSMCPVVEGLTDLGNISAVFRSADALGFQSVHVISNEMDRRYKKNRKVSMGSEKWLDAELWDTSQDCLETLRRRGYRIAVTHVAKDTVSILDIDWTVPTAVVFGNEHRGVSERALEMSDLRCSIPMNGMVDSFNVSVAAGILMHHVVHDRLARLGKHGDLLPEEQQILKADFYLRHSSQTLSILDRLLDKKQAGRQSSLRSLLKGELEADIEAPECLKFK